MRNARIEATWKDLAVIRQTIAPRVMPVDEPFPFFPTQDAAPAFENCCTTNRCHKCK